MLCMPDLRKFTPDYDVFYMQPGMQGKVPSLAELVALHNVIANAADLRMPIHLSDQLSRSFLDDNVKQSMMDLLTGSTASAVLQKTTSLSVAPNTTRMWVTFSILLPLLSGLVMS